MSNTDSAKHASCVYIWNNLLSTLRLMEFVIRSSSHKSSPQIIIHRSHSMYDCLTWATLFSNNIQRNVIGVKICKTLSVLRHLFYAFIWKGKTCQIKLTIISNQHEEEDRCALKMSLINRLLEPLNVSLLYFTS
jgi:hypothetical protein